MSFKEITLWFGVMLVTVFAFLSTYYFDFSAPIKGLVWVGWCVFAGLLSFFTSKGMMFFLFLKEAKVELQKVVWPTRQETIQTTLIVILMVSITGFVLWGIDSGMTLVIGKLTHLG